MSGKSGGSLHVCCGFRMLAAVEFDDQISLAAGKIGDVRTNGQLADKLETH
ncbi:hypothetical protein D3C71_2129570 [compost metagenome]